MCENSIHWIEHLFVELKLVHTAEYLESLKSSYNVAGKLFTPKSPNATPLTTPNIVITEVPICAIMPNFLVRRRVLNPMLYATSGTILAGKGVCVRGVSGIYASVYARALLDTAPSMLSFPIWVLHKIIKILDRANSNLIREAVNLAVINQFNVQF